MDLRAEQLEVDRDGVLALAGVDLWLPPGGKAQILGPAASGKTTLLKALAGLVRPTGGRVLWDGLDPARLSSSERRQQQARFGMVFQTDALFDSLSVLENVRLPLLNRQVPAAEATARAYEALSRVGLSAAAANLPETLSGGMRKRAGLARAIVARPEILLVDDPTAGLDPSTCAQVLELLREVAQGASLVAAAPEPLERLGADRCWRLAEGRLTEAAAFEVRP